MKEYTGIKGIDQMLDAAEVSKDIHGNESREIFYSCERYLFDFNIDKTWQQFDTENDAWYLGFWVNKTRFRTLAYVEGDIYFVQCPDAERYDAEVARMCESQQPGASFSVLDSEGNLTRYYQDRATFFIDPINCPPSPIQFTNEKDEPET